jgi:hypothetical protein
VAFSGVLLVLYGSAHTPWGVMSVSTPLFLEDENIFRKSATLVVIIDENGSAIHCADDLRPAGTVILARAYFVRAPARAGTLRPDLVFIITFRKIIPGHKTRIERRASRFSAICTKSCAKIKYQQSYSNSTTQITLRGEPPL